MGKYLLQSASANGLKQQGPMTCERKCEIMKDDGVCFLDSNNNLVYLGFFKCFLNYIIYLTNLLFFNNWPIFLKTHKKIVSISVKNIGNI